VRHILEITGVKVGAEIGPGQAEVWTVGLPAKTSTAVCDVPGHIHRGATAAFNLT